MILGFTGTRKEITKYQFKTLYTYLNSKKVIEEVHHGCCRGADFIFHTMALKKNLKIIAHPPLSQKYMIKSCLNKSFIVKEAKNYIERNHDIVDSCDILIACPFEDIEQLRSGTWATIRYAKKQNKSIYIIYPTYTERIN